MSLLKHCLLLLFTLLLCSCSNQKREYNLKVKNKTNIELENVMWQLKPEGHFEPGFLSPNQGKVYMMIVQWPAPTEIELFFKDDKGKQYKFKLYPKLPKGFYGDILVIIKRKNAKFYTELKTGKIRSLVF